MDTPDLSFYYALHQRMRVSSRRLAAALCAVPETDRVERGASLVRWYGGFESELHAHHTIEDTLFFPALFERVSSLEAYLTRIDDEHHELTDLLVRTRTAIGAMADPSAAWAPALRDAHGAAVGLETLLERHLDFEDHEVLPLFVRHFDKDEYQGLHDTAMKSNSIGQLKFTVPWVMAGLDRDEQAKTLDDAPFALRILWYATRRGYARLETAALGATTDGATTLAMGT